MTPPLTATVSGAKGYAERGRALGPLPVSHRQSQDRLDTGDGPSAVGARRRHGYSTAQDVLQEVQERPAWADPADGILDIKGFRAVNLEVLNFPNPIPNLTVSVNMGKIRGNTLAQEIETFSLGGPVLIHTYSVVGPDLAVWILGAPPNTNVDLQAWVFLH